MDREDVWSGAHGMNDTPDERPLEELNGAEQDRRRSNEAEAAKPLPDVRAPREDEPAYPVVEEDAAPPEPEPEPEPDAEPEPGE